MLKVYFLIVPNTNHNFYCSRYDYPSLLLHVVSNHRKIFKDVSMKAPGGTDDSTHFRGSLLYNHLTSVWRHVGQGCQRPRPPCPPLRHRDWCFPLLPFMLTLFFADWNGDSCPKPVQWNAREWKVYCCGSHCTSQGKVEDSSRFEHQNSVQSSLLEGRLFLCSFISIF